MSTDVLLRSFNGFQILACFALLAVCLRRRYYEDFPALTTFLAVHAISDSICYVLLTFRAQLGMAKPLAYHIYMTTYWLSFVLQSVLMLTIVYGIYREALRPFEPLRKLGMIIFRWVAAISAVIALSIAIGPHVLSSNFIGVVAGQAQQFINILTVCMLVFVCFALKPLGIHTRSHLFGVSLGLGTLATASLVQAAWLSTTAAQSLHSPIYLIGAVGSCLASSIWGIYFFLPQAERRTILLPTTSPYFFWNRISEALGDAPGFVAIQGLEPDMFNVTELEAFYQAHPVQPTETEMQTLMRPFPAPASLTGTR